MLKEALALQRAKLDQITSSHSTAWHTSRRTTCFPPETLARGLPMLEEGAGAQEEEVRSGSP